MRKSGFMEGAIIATLAIFLTKFIGIVYVTPFYSIVGSQGGALYGYAYNIYNFFLIISSAGIPLAISKLSSEYNTLNMQKEKEYMFKLTQIIILIFSIISFLLCFLLAPFIADLIIGNITNGNSVADVTFVIRCVSFAILIVPLLSVSRGYLQGHGYITPASLSQVIEQIIRVLIIIFGSFYTLKILHLSLKSAIGVAVFGASIGALISYFYLMNKLFKVKSKNKVDSSSLSKEDKLNILKKIITYSIPFIITNVANTLYNTTDMILLNRGLVSIGFSDIDTETISGIFTTWGNKLNVIVTSIATGIAISLVPNVAKSNAQKDYKAINNIFNKTLQIFFYIALPLAIFMSIFSTSIWQVFYGPSEFGPIVFRYSIITAALDALCIMICNGLQGLNKSKLIYISIFLGLGINLLLDIPLIKLFNSLNIYPYYGAITATLIGYLISLVIPLVTLKRKYKINYESTIKKLPKLFSTYIIMILLSLLFSGIIKGISNRLLLIVILGIIGIVLLVIYYIFNRNELENLFGKSIKNIIRKKREE